MDKQTHTQIIEQAQFRFCLPYLKIVNCTHITRGTWGVSIGLWPTNCTLAIGPVAILIAWTEEVVRESHE